METSLQVKRQLVLFEAEEWRVIPKWEDYEASNWGRVRSLDRISRGGHKLNGRMMKASDANGYQLLMLWNDDGGRTMGVHVAVALAFIGPPPTPDHQVNHIDGNKANNRPENLEWVTPKQNVQHAIHVLGRDFSHRGEKNPRAVLTEALVRELRSRYRPGVRGLVAQLAREFNVPYRATYQAITGRSWPHL